MDNGIILVIDDEINKEYAKPYFQTMKDIIDSISYSYLFIDNGEEGIEAVKNDKSKKIEMVILDNEFVGQDLQGGDILKELKILREDLPIIMLSIMPRGDSKNRNKEKHPSSKSSRRLGAIIYIEKKEFFKKPSKVKYQILAILKKSEYTLVLDCKNKKIDIKDNKGSILKNPIEFNEVTENWENTIYPFNEDHFLFKLIYMAAKQTQTNRQVLLSDVFKLVRDTDDTGKSKGIFTWIEPAGLTLLISKMKKISLSENDKSNRWNKLINALEEDPYNLDKIEKSKEFVEVHNINNLEDDFKNYIKQLDNVPNTISLNINDMIYEFNQKVNNQSNGKVLFLLKGKGQGRPKRGNFKGNVFTLCIEDVKILNDYNGKILPDILRENELPIDEQKFITKEELKKELHTLKEELFNKIETICRKNKLIK